MSGARHRDDRYRNDRRDREWYVPFCTRHGRWTKSASDIAIARNLSFGTIDHAGSDATLVA
jgi:hypothetical protein